MDADNTAGRVKSRSELGKHSRVEVNSAVRLSAARTSVGIVSSGERENPRSSPVKSGFREKNCEQDVVSGCTFHHHKTAQVDQHTVQKVKAS